MCMTSRGCWPSRNFWRSASILLLLSSLSACTTLSSDDTEEVIVAGKPKRVRRNISSQFEWAVQSYEAGAYEEAVSRFEKLRKDGSEVPDFDLVAYYLGMSRFRLGEFEAAARELEAFLRAAQGRQEAQDARLTLLLADEKLGRWKEATALSAETDKLTLFQYNRALLKLLWARALREQGELQGARAVLEDSAAYLDKVGKEESRPIPFYSNPEQDLWGRYHFTATLIKTKECALLGPKNIGKPGKGKKKGQEKESPAARPNNKFLYAPWLEAETDCLRTAVKTASEELFARESPWAPPAGESLLEGVNAFGSEISQHLKAEAARLESHRALQKAARENLYRLLGTVDEHLKNFKDRGISSPRLDDLRKQLDRLLVSISGPS